MGLKVFFSSKKTLGAVRSSDRPFPLLAIADPLASSCRTTVAS